LIRHDLEQPSKYAKRDQLLTHRVNSQEQLLQGRHPKYGLRDVFAEDARDSGGSALDYDLATTYVIGHKAAIHLLELSSILGLEPELFGLRLRVVLIVTSRCRRVR